MNHKHIHWLGHASFRIEDSATQIYIDPWKLPANAPKADVIFITHAHYDHFSTEDLAKIRKDGTAFLTPKDVAYQLKGTVIAVSPGEIYNIGDLKVKTVPAYNIGKQYIRNKTIGSATSFRSQRVRRSITAVIRISPPR